MHLGLLQRLDELAGVGAHGALGDIDVVVVHQQHAEILLLRLLAARLELRHRADGRGLRGLAAGVGIDLGIDEEHIHVLAHGEHVIQTAVADVVRPAVAAVHPHGLLGEVLFALEDLLRDGLLLCSELRALERGDQLLRRGRGGVQIVIDREIAGDGRLDRLVLRQGVELPDVVRRGVAQLPDGEAHAVGELGIVFKQGVRPRDALALRVLAVRDARHGRAPRLRAAGSVGEVHLVAEELGQELGIRRLAAARARAVELQQRLAELAALEGELVARFGLLRQAREVRPLRGHLMHLVGGHHLQRLSALRAGGDAAAAARAVERGDAHRILVVLDLRALGVREGHPGGRGLHLILAQQERADHRVRADKRAHVALQALGRVPHRQVRRDAALFILRGAERHRAVLHPLEGGDRQLVALLGIDRHEDVADHVGQVGVCGLQSLAGEVRPLGLHLHLDEGVDARVDGLQVHVHDLLALEPVGLLHSGLHVRHGILHGDDVRELEERRLQHHVRAVAETDRLRLPVRVDDVEVDVVVGDVLEDLTGDVLLQLALLPLAVEQEAAVRLELVDNVVFRQVRLVVAGDEVGAADIVGRADRLLAEAQMALRDAEGLLRVVLKVRLTVHIGRVADDLDGVLVRADRAVGAEAPELAADRALRLGQKRRAHGQGQVRHIVHDADGEVILRLVEQQVVEHCLELGGGRVLAGEAVAAGIDLRTGLLVDERGADILIQRLADRAHLLHAVEHGDLPHCLGKRRQQVLAGEGAEQVYLQEADLLALGGEVVDDLLRTAGDAAHRDDDALGVRCAVVVEEVILAAGQPADLGHIVLDDAGQLVIGRVVCLAELEVDVGVVDERAHTRILGVEGVGAEGGQRVIVDELRVLVVVHDVDLLDLVARAEAVEEVQERDVGADGAQVRHGGEIRRLLHAAAGEQGKARLAAVHHVGVVAEDGEGVRAHRAGCYMQHHRQPLARDAVQRRDHEHQSLRSGEARRERTGLERAVTCAARAGLGLHLHETHGLAEDVLFALGGPLVRMLCHRRGGRDGIDRRHLGKRVGYIRRRFVTVTDFGQFLHSFILPSASAAGRRRNIPFVRCLFPMQLALCIYNCTAQKGESLVKYLHFFSASSGETYFPKLCTFSRSSAHFSLNTKRSPKERPMVFPGAAKVSQSSRPESRE